MTDITPRLLRLALREVMADTRRSIESMAETLDMSGPDLRSWLNMPKSDWSGRAWIAHVDRGIDRYLARYESRGTGKICGKCKEGKPLMDFNTKWKNDQWCKACHREYDAALYKRKKLELAAAV